MTAKRPVPVLLACGLLVMLGAAGVIGADGAPFAPKVVAMHDFEGGNMFGWVTRGGVGVTTLTSEAAHSGSSCLKMTGRNGQDWHSARVELTGVLQKGAKYEIELWVRLLPGQKPAPMSIVMLNRSSSDKETDITGEGVEVTDSAWTLLKGQWEYEATSTSGYLYVFLRDKPDFKGGYYLDDVKITQITAAPKPGEPVTLSAFDFEDGRTQGWMPRGAGVQIAFSTEAAQSGSASLKTTKRSANWHGAAINVLGMLQKNAVYNITGFVKLVKTPASPSTIKFTMEQKPAGGSTGWVTVAQGTAADDQWLKLSGDYTFADDMEALTLYAESSNKDDEFFVDNVTITMTAPPPEPTVEQDLPALKESVPFLIGAAVEPGQLSGVQGEMLRKHFNVLVAENVMKPGPIHPTEDTYNWSAADQLVKFAADNKMAMRYHTLEWHSQVNEWFFMDADGKDMSAETDPVKRAANKKLLLKRLEDHITTIVGRYKDRIKYWDVVNEVIEAGQPDGMRRNKWYLIAGKDYVETAFRAARNAGGREIKLYINDYQTDEPNKRDALFNLVQEMLKKGVPIDGVGHQCHVNIDGPSVTAIADSIKKFASLGLDNQITELDVSVYTNNSQSYQQVPRELLVKQGYRYQELFSMFRQLKSAISCVVLWGFTDSHTWLHNRPIARRDAPFPFDELCHAKPAYWGIVDPGRLPAYAQKLDIAKGAVVIDGYADPDTSWKTATWTPFRFSEGVEACFKALWDEKNLYLLVQVQDKSMSAGDMVEVFIDADNKKNAGAYDPDDKRYEFRRDNHSRDAVYRVVNLKAGGYQIEAQIPLAGAVVGRQIGFDIRATDANQASAVASWNDRSHRQNVDPSRFGTLNLTAPAGLTRAIKGTPKIDADIDTVWARADVVETAVYVQGKGVATAKARTMWDENYLYVLAEVKDHLLNKANANAWEQDSVEIFIDENNAKTPVYQADDAQYRVNFDNLQTFGSNGQDARFKSAAKRVDGGYVVEIAVPFRTIKGQAGLLIGFDLQVNDADASGRRVGVVTWNDPIGNDYRDTTKFGNLMLAL